VKSEVICKKELFGRPKAFLQTAYGILPDVCQEMMRGARHFEEIEVWGKRKIRKDPIAVGAHRKWQALSNLPLGNG
jgi:hypothetical protein